MSFSFNPFTGNLDDINTKATKINMEVLGSNTTFTTVQEMQDIFHSSGVGFGGAISDNGDGTYSVAAGGGYIRATNDPTSVLYSFDWSANNSLTPSDGRNYVGVEYNAGSPQVVQRSSYDWNYQTDFPLGEVVKEGSVLHIFNAQHKVGDHAGKMIESMEDTMAFARDQRTGGLIIGETGTRNVTMSAGYVWFGLTEFTINEVDTSGSDTFDTYYRDGVGGWTLGTGVTQWQNSQYDDGSGTLQNLTVNRYAANWVYLDVEAGGTLVLVYPQAQYATLAAAEEDSPPTNLPERLVSHGKLIGRIIFQQGASTASSIETVFTTLFSSSQIVNHNNLAGLQGGAAGEYYHLTNAELTELQAIDTTYVPYTGATSDVNLGIYDVEATEVRVKASNNHVITSTADDLLVQNFNNQDSILFETTDASGNTDRVLEIGGINQTIKISNERSQGIGPNGIIDVSGTWVAANSATLRFRPTISSGNFYGILFDPSLQSNNIAYGIAFNPVMSVGSNLTLLQFNPTLTANGNNIINRYTENLANLLFNAAVTNTYNAISLGAARSAYNFGGGAPTFNEEMIKLNGGATVNDAVAGGSSITQKGLIFSGFGTVSNTGGTVNVKAMEANGGLFDFQFDNGTFGAVRFGAGNDASIGYDGTDMTIDTAVAGSGVLKLSASTNWTANGTGTVTISNVAPAGVATATISKWLTVKDNSGNTMYIPAWM